MKRQLIRRSTFAFALAVALVSSMAAGQTPGPEPAQLRGLSASCQGDAQAELDFAVAAYFAGAWTDVERATGAALRADSGCAMAHWLRALGLLGTPVDWKRGLPARQLAVGRMALDHAREAGLRTQRERDYVDALTIMYADDGVALSARVQAFQAALAGVAERLGDDGVVLRSLAMIERANCSGR